MTVKMVPGQKGCPAYLFRADPLLFHGFDFVAPPIQGVCCSPVDGVSSPLHRRWRTGNHCRDKLQLPWGAARNPSGKTSSELSRCLQGAYFFRNILGCVRDVWMPAIGERLNIGEFKMSRYNNNLQFIRRKIALKYMMKCALPKKIKINK